MPTRLAAVPLLASALAACSTSGSDAGLDLVAEGSGAVNAEPLMPMRVGARHIYGSPGYLLDRVVAAAPQVEGASGRRLEWSNGEVTWWRHAGSGWELWGGNDGALPEPVMTMPDTVRVGMRWDSAGNHFEVRGRKTELTPWGPRLVWTVHHSRDDGQVTRDLDYVEGRGLWRERGLGDSEALYASFAPLGEQEVADPDAPRLALQPVLGPDGKHLVLDLEGTPYFAIEDAPERSIVGVAGQSWAFLGGAYELISHNVCLRIEPGGGQQIEATRPAGTFMIEDHGACMVPFSSGPGEAAMSHHRYPWVSPETGEVFYAEETEDLLRVELWYTFAEPGARTPWLLGEFGGWARLASWGNEAWDWEPKLRDATLPLEDLVHFDPRTIGLLAPPLMTGDRHPLVMVTASGLVATSEFVRGEGATTPRPRTWLGFNLLPTTSAEHRTAISSRAGFIDELEVTADGPRVRRLARYTLPANHFDTGVVRVGDQLLITSGDRIDGADTVNGVDARRTYLWRVPAPRGSGAEVHAPPSLAVGARRTGLDAVVCWPPTDEALDTDGWSLGGAPAAHVQAMHDGGCALVMRDLGRAEDPWLDGGGLVEGPVPGVGRMEITLPLGTEPFGDPADPRPLQSIWPTSDGGFVSADRVHGPAGTALHTAPSRFGLGVELQDATAAGFWQVDGGRLRLVTGDGREVFSEQEWLQGDGRPESIRLLGPAAGGGAVMAILEDLFHVGLSGAVEALELEWPRGATGYTLGARLADGAMCFSLVGTVLCRRSAGEDTEVPDVSAATLWPLSDGRLLAASEAGFQLVDVGSATATTLEGGGRGHLVYGGDGDLFFLPMVRDGRNNDIPSEVTWPYEVTGDGLVPLDLAPFEWFAGYQADIARLVPARDFFFVFFQNGNLLRVPR